MKILLIVTVFLFGVVYAILDALHDSYFIKGTNKWHQVDAIIKTIEACLLSVFLLIGFFIPIYNFNTFIYCVISIPFTILSIRLLIFDSFLNYFRGMRGKDIFSYKMYVPWFSKIIIFIVSSSLFLWFSVFM